MSELHPDLVLLPRPGRQPTHRRVHAAGIAALADARHTVLACTEFWSTCAAPNALVQTKPSRHHLRA